MAAFLPMLREYLAGESQFVLLFTPPHLLQLSQHSRFSGFSSSRLLSLELTSRPSLPPSLPFLTVSNPIPSSFSNTTSSTPTQISTPTPSAPDQYVYDLYYHSLSTHPSPNSAEASMVARATVEGYIAEGEEELVVESDDEEESDEVDEDSNGEFHPLSSREKGNETRRVAVMS